MRWFGGWYPLVIELIPPENAQDAPRPRSAGLVLPRQLENVCQKVARSGLLTIPALFVYDIHPPPLAIMPCVPLSPEATPADALRVNR